MVNFVKIISLKQKMEAIFYCLFLNPLSEVNRKDILIDYQHNGDDGFGYNDIFGWNFIFLNY